MERELFPRLSRTLGLEPEVFQEIASDREATAQAGLVVLLAGVCAGLGALLAGRGIGTLLGGTASLMVGWLVLSWLAYAVGVSFFQGKADYGTLLRVIGFAHAPLLLRLFRFVPFFGGVLWEATLLWTLLAAIVAIRQAFGFSTPRALATIAVGWVLPQIVLAGLGRLWHLLPLPFGWS
jgi:hypothetical protein